MGALPDRRGAAPSPGGGGVSLEQQLDRLTAALERSDALNQQLAALLVKAGQPVQPKAYRKRDAAAAIGVSVRTLDQIIGTGQLATIVLPSMSEPRIPAASLDELVAPERWRTATLTLAEAG